MPTDEAVDALLSGWRWPGASLTYSFWDTPEHRWTSAEMAAVSSAFAAYEAVTALRFTHVPAPSGIAGDNATDISIQAVSGLTGNEGVPVAGIGKFPAPPYAGTTEGDLTLNLDAWYAAGGDLALRPGYDMYETLLHEIGHVLGLKHPHDSIGGTRPTLESAGVGALDTELFSVMSRASTGGQQLTPMALDQAALQHMYGPGPPVRPGDDVYGYDVAGALKTIYDTGGFDAFDASGYGHDLSIDLAPFGVICGLADRRDGGGLRPVDSMLREPDGTPLRVPTDYYESAIVIGAGTRIENGTSGAGNDIVRGNAADNVLIGNAGDDFLDGRDGTDRLIGGAGADFFRAGATGLDTVLDFTFDDALVFSKAEGPATWRVTAQADGPTRIEAGGEAILAAGFFAADRIVATVETIGGIDYTALRLVDEPT